MKTVLKEHFEYLSDPRRLELLRAATSRVVRPGDLVADVGCGFGILGLMALEAGASEVWGIDLTEAIEIARESMTRSGFSERYHCLRNSSFRATLPVQVDVAVCDHIGFFGFDYGIVEMLGDVRRRMLKPGGTIMPERIRPIVAGVTSQECRGKVEAWCKPPIPSEYGWLRELATNRKYPHAFDPVDIATEVATLGEIDFRRENPEHFSWRASVPATTDCLVDGLGGWFEADLAPGVVMTNSPLDKDRIGRDQVFLPFAEPIALRGGEHLDITVSVRLEGSLIVWSAGPKGGGRRQKQSTWQSRILEPDNFGSRRERKLQQSAIGKASAIIRSYVDGQRNAAEIESAVLRDHSGLFPSREEIVRFVHGELARFAE